MINLCFLAWLFWNPSPDAFTIPFLNMPIAWYGILFAGGFVVGYFIFVPMVQQLIQQNRQVYARDIKNWNLLAVGFKDNKDFCGRLSKKGRLELQAMPSDEESSASLKQELLDALNGALQDSAKLHRKNLEEMFPGAFQSARALSQIFTDRLVWFVVLGTIIGARLGHILFYEWSYYVANPIEIFMIRKGGLASHGGTLGVIVGLILFIRWNRKLFPDFSLIKLIDTLVVPTAFTVCCIRLGNFFNQEILGRETTLPWAIIFGHPADGSIPLPRHPVQLYEAAIYLSTFFLLYGIWRWRGATLKTGILSGIFFIIVFGSRFFIEYLKELQGSIIDETFLQMGQYLSIPFVILGIVLLMLPKRYFSASSCNT